MLEQEVAEHQQLARERGEDRGAGLSDVRTRCQCYMLAQLINVCQPWKHRTGKKSSLDISIL